MKRLFLLLIFFFFALWLGLKIAQDPGYILISYQRWTIEMPLWLGAVFLIFFSLLLYGVFRLFHHTRRFGSYFRFWSKKSRGQRAMKKTYQGFLEVLNGKFKSGEKKLLRGADYSPIGWLNYLDAAKAAFLQKAYGRSQAYFDKALEKEPQAAVAIGVAKAALEVEAQNWEEGLAILKPLALQAPNNPHILSLLKVIYQQLYAWQDLVNLIPRLQKSPLETRESIKILERQAFLGLLQTAPKQDLHKIWHIMPRTLHRDPLLIRCYVEGLNQLQEVPEAEAFLKKYLKHQWDESLIDLYGRLITDRPGRQLSFAQSFVKQHPENSVLLLCLGRLAAQAGLWGMAKSYLEACIQKAPSVESYKLLGGVLEQLGNKEAAFSMYRAGSDRG
jgi:HemY protein